MVGIYSYSRIVTLWGLAVILLQLHKKFIILIYYSEYFCEHRENDEQSFSVYFSMYKR